ncbi:MAG: hypothetical protein ACOZBW_00655 [Thermodesulfobacteriota bacterium]
MAAVIWGLPGLSRADTVFVFANADVADGTLTQMEMQNIYLGKKDKWSDNRKINFAALNSGTCHDEFLKQHVARTDFQFQNYWKKQIFTGQGQPPKAFGSEADLIDYVSRTSGAIGYSCTAPDKGKVKIMTVQ